MAIIIPFPHYSGFTQFTPVVPELYWNVYSHEERIKALCMEYVKLTAFTDSIVDTLNGQYAIIEEMQEQFPQLVNDDVIAEMRRLIDAGEFTPILEEAIEEWMNERSAQVDTNTENIASINSVLPSVRIVDNYNDLLDTTEDKVFVVNDNGSPRKNNLSGSLFIKTTKDTTTLPYTRADGSKVIGAPNQQNLINGALPKTAIGEVIASYLGNENLVYGNYHTLFSPDCTNEIDCSSFVQAVLLGIKYEYSRYALGSAADNILGSYACGTSISKGEDSGTYPRSQNRNLMYTFAERGELYEFDDELTWQNAIRMLRFGDLLCIGNDETHPERHWSQHHQQFVLATYPEEGVILVAQSGLSGDGLEISSFYGAEMGVRASTCRFSTGYRTHYKAFIRPNYGDGQDEGINISGAPNFEELVVNSSTESVSKYIAQINPSKPITAGKMHSLTVKGDMPESSIVAQLRYTDYSGNGHNIMSGSFKNLGGKTGEITFIFKAPEEFRTIGIRAWSDSVSIPYGEELTYSCNEISLVEGVAFGSSGSKTAHAEKIENIDIRDSSYIDGAGNLIVDILINNYIPDDESLKAVAKINTRSSLTRYLIGSDNGEVKAFTLASNGEIKIATTTTESHTLRIFAQPVTSTYEKVTL